MPKITVQRSREPTKSTLTLVWTAAPHTTTKFPRKKFSRQIKRLGKPFLQEQTTSTHVTWSASQPLEAVIPKASTRRRLRPRRLPPPPVPTGGLQRCRRTAMGVSTACQVRTRSTFLITPQPEWRCRQGHTCRPQGRVCFNRSPQASRYTGWTPSFRRVDSLVRPLTTPALSPSPQLTWEGPREGTAWGPRPLKFTVTSRLVPTCRRRRGIQGTLGPACQWWIWTLPDQWRDELEKTDNGGNPNGWNKGLTWRMAGYGESVKHRVLAPVSDSHPQDSDCYSHVMWTFATIQPRTQTNSANWLDFSVFFSFFLVSHANLFLSLPVPPFWRYCFAVRAYILYKFVITSDTWPAMTWPN